MLAPVAKHPILHNIDKVKGQPKKRKEKEKKKKKESFIKKYWTPWRLVSSSYY